MIKHFGYVHCSCEDITHKLQIRHTSRLSSNIFEPPPEKSIDFQQAAGRFPQDGHDGPIDRVSL